MGEHARLARAGAGEDQQRPLAVHDGVALGRVEARQQLVDPRVLGRLGHADPRYRAEADRASIAGLPREEPDIIVVGAGIIGLAVARELLARHPGRSVSVLEREDEIGFHQTGHNSGVLHAGIYYAPGSLKARLCTEGAPELLAYCQERGIPARQDGKLIVALDRGEVPRLDELERRGRANGVPGLKRLRQEEIAEFEPHVQGVDALHSPATAVVDFQAVAREFAKDVEAAGGEVVTGCAVDSADLRANRLCVRHSHGESRARFARLLRRRVVGPAGRRRGRRPRPPHRPVPRRLAAYAARTPRPRARARLPGAGPRPPVPRRPLHPRHRRRGPRSAPPRCWPARATASAASPPPTCATRSRWRGTYRMARRWWRTGLTELRHAADRRALVRDGARYIPELTPDDVAARPRRRARPGARPRR